MKTCKDEVKRLEKELIKSKEKIHKYSKEIIILKKYRNQIEEYIKKKHIKKVWNIKKDYKN